MKKLSIFIFTLLLATTAMAQRLEPPKVEIFGFEVVAAPGADEHGHGHDTAHDHADQHRHASTDGHAAAHGHGDEHEHTHVITHSHHHEHGHHNSHNHAADLPGFRLGIFVRNPNDINLNPEAIKFRITLEDEVVLSGRKTDLGRIEGLVRQKYDFVFVPTNPDQIEQLRNLMNRQADDYDYELDVKVSFGSFRNDYTAQDSGEIDLHDRD